MELLISILANSQLLLFNIFQYIKYINFNVFPIHMGYANSLKLKILKYFKNYFYTELLKFAEDFIALYWLIIKEYLNDDEYLFNDDGK